MSKRSLIVVIVISEFLERHLQAKRTSALAIHERCDESNWFSKG